MIASGKPFCAVNKGNSRNKYIESVELVSLIQMLLLGEYSDPESCFLFKNKIILWD